jgi:hypothetical protein
MRYDVIELVDAIEGDEVYAGGEWTPVERVHVFGARGDLVKIFFPNGGTQSGPLHHYGKARRPVVEAPVAAPSTDPGWYTEPEQVVAADTATLVKVHAAALTAYTNAGGHRFAAMNERVYLMCRAELAHRGAYDPSAVDDISRVVMERARKAVEA